MNGLVSLLECIANMDESQSSSLLEEPPQLWQAGGKVIGFFAALANMPARFLVADKHLLANQSEEKASNYLGA